MTTRPPWRTSSTVAPSGTGMRTRGSSGPEIAGGGGGSGSGSSLGWRCCWASAPDATIASARTSRRRMLFLGQPILLEVEQHLALGGRGLEAALLVEREDRVHHLLRLVMYLHEVHVGGVDHVLPDQALAEPGDEPAPIRLVHQDDRHLARLAGLHQCERLEQLVERAEAAGQDDERGGELREHHLAREEMLEAKPDVVVPVRVLLARQIDVEAHREALAVEGALVGGFHHPGPAARDHRETGVGEQPRSLLGKLVVRLARSHARAAEYRHGGTDPGEPLGRLDELCHNAERPPRLASRDLAGE